MSDVDARLVQADPFLGQHYEHPDLERLITRVTSVSARPTSSRVWRGFQLRVAGALAASVLVTVGAIAAIQDAGSGLSVLTLTATGFTPSITPSAAQGVTMITSTSHATFVAAKSLSSSVPSTLSYRLSTPDSPSKEASRLATIFNVAGTPVETATNHAQWTVNDARGDQLTYLNVGVPRWRYVSSAKPVIGPLPSRATVASDAQRYVTQLGDHYDLAAPSFSTVQSISGTNATAPSELAVSYSVNIAHLATGQTLTIAVNANNQIVLAIGPDFAVASSAAYPLQSPRDASNDLARAKASSAEFGSAARPAASTVKLTESTLSLRAYRLKDGTLWLLPVYTLRGNATGARTFDQALLVIALQPRYVAIRPGASVTRSSIVSP